MADKTRPSDGAPSRQASVTDVPNAFIGWAEKPSEAELDKALGPSSAAWRALISDLAAGHGVDIQEWSGYSRKAGWSLRLKRGKRTILWLSPCQGCFRVAFILGDKALLAARQARLPASAVAALDSAPRYPEGTGVRFLIRGPKDLPAIMKLAVVKMEN